MMVPCNSVGCDTSDGLIGASRGPSLASMVAAALATPAEPAFVLSEAVLLLRVRLLLVAPSDLEVNMILVVCSLSDKVKFPV